ncbi:MAG: thiomuracin/GE37468 family thiazolyl RiPP peptide [Egibacteraceae bacterium]
MDKLSLDLETLEVERLDVRAIGLNGGLESLSMGHGGIELGASCEPADPYCGSCG